MVSKFGDFNFIDLFTFLSFLIQFLIQSIIACLCFGQSFVNRKVIIYTYIISLRTLITSCFLPRKNKILDIFYTFPYLIDFPANVLSGNSTNIIGGLCMQIFWILLFFPLFRKAWIEGTKKFTAMGS